MQFNVNALRQCSPPTGRVGDAAPSGRESSAPNDDFGAVLRQTVAEEPSGLRFSRHAQERMARRDIELTPDELDRLGEATEKAAAKGAREALMMMGNLNLIVSVQNRTVVTAMAQDGSEDQVFTNIDTAVMVGPSASGDE